MTINSNWKLTKHEGNRFRNCSEKLHSWWNMHGLGGTCVKLLRKKYIYMYTMEPAWNYSEKTHSWWNLREIAQK